MSTNPSEKQRGNDIDVTGLTVARNVKRLRRESGLTQQELSDDLRKMGRPIPVASIGKIESGSRRVEVDDLVALAIALGTNPNGLLMPHSRGPQDQFKITGRDAISAFEIWSWAIGELPLDPLTDWEDAQVQWSTFSSMSLPWWVMTTKLITDAEGTTPGMEALMNKLHDEAEARVDAPEESHPQRPGVIEVTPEMAEGWVAQRNRGSNGEHQEAP